MSHSYNSCLLHVVFSTKDRHKSIAPEIAPRLWSFIGGTARDLRMKAIIVGGVEDHVHALVSIPATISTAKAVQHLKANSSRWIHETFPTMKTFAWQEGYGAFSVSISQRENTVAYIRSQPEHHRKIDFQEEFRTFLRRHGIEIAPDEFPRFSPAGAPDNSPAR